MNHTKFEQGQFSFNDLSDGLFENISFIFCDTKDNTKTDAVFKNSEMIQSTKRCVHAVFNDFFEAQNLYSYSLSIVYQNGVVENVTKIPTMVAEGASGVSFLVHSADLQNAKVLRVVKSCLSSFGSLFMFSQNEEEIVKLVQIDDILFFPGVCSINGKRVSGFVRSKNTGIRKRSNSL